MSEPDDTPTSLEKLQRYSWLSAGMADGYRYGPISAEYLIASEVEDCVQALAAEVSRLREAQAKKQAESDYWRGKFNFADGALATAEADVSRLQQENALFRRSLEMLTKQLEQRDEDNRSLRLQLHQAGRGAW